MKCSQALEDQEKHLLVKVIDRVLYKLEDVDHPSALPSMRLTGC